MDTMDANKELSSQGKQTTEVAVRIFEGLDPLKTRNFYLAALSIVIITLIAYSPLPWNKFVIYDDPEYVTENINVLHGLTKTDILWSFSSTYQSNWHPLTWISHMLDIQLFGLNPVGHHCISLLLHLANSLLVLVVLRNLTGALWRSALVALLFAIHPLHVESVAWVSERKDLLCAFFWLLTIQAYLFYVNNPEWKRYLLFLVTFALGVMSKPMIVTLPCVLFLLDFWPLVRKSRLVTLIAEKIPLFVMSAGSAYITYRIQIICGRPAVIDMQAQMNALQSYMVYLMKTVYPTNLAVLYPFDENRLTLLRSGSAAVLLFAVTIAVVWQVRKRPYLFVGWFWFIGALVPVIGILRIGYHSYANRYTYIPHIGLFVLIIWGGAELLQDKVFLRKCVGIVLIVIVVTFSAMTYQQVKIWENTITLMKQTLSVTENNWFAYNTLACAYYLIGTTHRVPNISASLPLYPDTLERRIAYMKMAVDGYRSSITIRPDYMSSNNLKMAIPLLEQMEREKLIQDGSLMK